MRLVLQCYNPERVSRKLVVGRADELTRAGFVQEVDYRSFAFLKAISSCGLDWSEAMKSCRPWIPLRFYRRPRGLEFRVEASRFRLS